jgi:hypothetical protein
MQVGREKANDYSIGLGNPCAILLVFGAFVWREVLRFIGMGKNADFMGIVSASKH